MNSDDWKYYRDQNELTLLEELSMEYNDDAAKFFMFFHVRNVEKFEKATPELGTKIMQLLYAASEYKVTGREALRANGDSNKRKAKAQNIALGDRLKTIGKSTGLSVTAIFENGIPIKIKFKSGNYVYEV